MASWHGLTIGRKPFSVKANTMWLKLKVKVQPCSSHQYVDFHAAPAPMHHSGSRWPGGAGVGGAALTKAQVSRIYIQTKSVERDRGVRWITKKSSLHLLFAVWSKRPVLPSVLKISEQVWQAAAAEVIYGQATKRVKSSVGLRTLELCVGQRG